MKKRRIVFVLLICILAAPVSSVLYKSLLGFYGFKRAMCDFVVPRNSAEVEDISLPGEMPVVDRIASLPLLSEWSPRAFTNKAGEMDGVKLTLSGGKTADFYLDPPSGGNIRDCLSAAAIELLETAYGGWKGVQGAYPTDRDLLNAIVAKELPSYLDRASSSMRNPLGYYVFPLFPPLEDYRTEYALFGVKAMETTNLSFLRAKGQSRFFFVFRDDQAAEIIFGDKASGATEGKVILASADEDVITTELIAKVCLCLDKAANKPTDSNKP